MTTPSDKVTDELGPVEGALIRVLFPIPIPGQVIPLDPTIPLAELNQAWVDALAAGELARQRLRPK